ncbi:putative ribonuclease H-like domain-containing protein, partial [Tanacetum coccineum]
MLKVLFSMALLERRGQIDKTLFIKRLKGDILLVQVYVDGIIFGSTKKSLCDEFEQIMHNRFQMSSMGELTFFLGLQVKQKEDGIFISQDKYIGEILKKFGFFSIRSASTPMETHKALTKDKDDEDVDFHLYRSMIRNPVYHSKTKHIDIRHHFIRDSYKKRLIEMVKIHTNHNVADLLTKAFDVSRFNFLVASIGKRGRETKIPQSGGPPIKVGDEAVHKELGDRMEMTATTSSSFEAEQDNDAQTRFEAASKSLMTHSLKRSHTWKWVGQYETYGIDGFYTIPSLEFCKKHNMVAYLIKTEGSEDFHEIINFLSGSHISYALTESPILYRSIIDQFWRTAVLSTTEEGDQAITATVDDKVIIISEASLRRHLKVKDSEGIPSLPNEEIFEPLTNMGHKQDVQLFKAEASSSSPSRITSSPSQSSEPSPEHTTTAAPSTYELQHSEPSPDAEGHVPTPHDSPLHSVHSHGSDEGRMRRAKLVLSDDKDIADDSSKQGRKISDIDEDPNTFLAQDEGVTWFQDDTDIQEVHQKQSHDTEVVIERGEPIEIVEDQGSGEKEVSTVDIPISTAGVTTRTATETPIVSTAGVNISTTSTIRSTTGRVVYSRRSADKAKDKGKAIMTEPEPQKKSKKLLEQERLGFETAIRLQEQADEEEKAQIARNEEI